nr:UDP-glycosyltransferase 73E1-like [Tanacetum cinerariifolium]
NIPRLVFHGPGCFTYLCLHIVMHTNILNEIESDADYFVVPGIKDRIELTKAQASGWGKVETKEMVDFFRRMEVAEEGADGIVVNSFQELEPRYVEELAKAKGKKVWCIGPVSLHNTSFLDLSERGNKAGINEHDCIKWLDKKVSGSVIFVCLGSMASISTEQIFELGLGLELSKVPFIWCIRNTTEESNKWLLEYEKKVKDRGLIVRGWAPQVLILSHKVVGGFLTHCGWNSTLEGVSAGIGVLVKKENIKTAVESIMDKEREGKVRRNRAKEFGEMAKRAMEEGGSSHLNTTLMIQDIIYRASSQKD